MQNDYEETQFTEKTVQNINTQYDGLKPKEKAGFIGLFISVVIPIVGIILYFVKKNKVANPGAYLLAAIIGIVFNYFMLNIA